MITATRGQFTGTVASNTALCDEHFKLTIRIPHFPEAAPGQFVQLLCSDIDISDSVEAEHEWRPDVMPRLDGEELVDRLAVLRRPFSLAGHRHTPLGVEIDIIHRVVGAGTDWLAHLKIDDSIQVLGPLGNAFKLPAKDQRALLVGGGVGIPPMIYLATRLSEHSAVAFSGALRKSLLPLQIRPTPRPAKDSEPTMILGEFADYNIPSFVTTDDGSLGLKGFVTDALVKYLDAHQDLSHVIYTCGPEPMMKAVAKIALDRNIECQIAVERAMACGMGTCQSCCIRVRKPDPAATPLPGKDWCYRLACTDGPVFYAKDLLW